MSGHGDEAVDAACVFLLFLSIVVILAVLLTGVLEAIVDWLQG